MSAKLAATRYCGLHVSSWRAQQIRKRRTTQFLHYRYLLDDVWEVDRTVHTGGPGEKNSKVGVGGDRADWPQKQVAMQQRPAADRSILRVPSSIVREDEQMKNKEK